MLKPSYAGNAIRIFLDIPSGVDRWRVLRRQDTEFSGYDDAAAVQVYDGADEKSILDYNFLVNGKTYYYRLYCRTGTEWTENDTKSAVPKNNSLDEGVDPQLFMRDRLEYGLNELVSRGVLQHPNGKIPVKIAPPTFDETVFLVVVVQFNSGSSQEYGIGNDFGQELIDSSDLWELREGWLSNVQIHVTAWSQNPDERIALRRAVEFIILSNLAVFESAGLINMSISQSDTEDFHSYSVPMYQSITTATCLSQRYVGWTEDRIRDITLDMDY